MPKFDRRPSEDPRNADFSIRTLLGAPSPPRTMSWAVQPVLDQGEEGACVGFAWAHELAGRPVEVGGVTNQLAHTLYEEARLLDEWPGEDYEGTSVLAGAKACKNRGKLVEYRWALSFDDLVSAVSWHGPAVLGLNWREGMMNPSFDTNILMPQGDIVGGHAILCCAVDPAAGVFKLHNSWGLSWGRWGEALIGFQELRTLWEDQGEACIPVRRSK